MRGIKKGMKRLSPSERRARVNERARLWREKTPIDKKRAIYKRWFNKNADAVRATNRERMRRKRAEDKDGMKAKWREWMNKPGVRARRNALSLEEHYRKGRARVMLRKYGITMECYDAMMAAQSGKCAICLTDSPRDGCKPSEVFCIDHDHSTGEVRGLLCRLCNLGVGNFRDDDILMAAAAHYVMSRKKASAA